MQRREHGRLETKSNHPVDPNNPIKRDIPEKKATLEELAIIRAKAMGLPIPGESLNNDIPVEEKVEVKAQEVIAPVETLNSSNVFSPEFVDEDSKDLPIIELTSPVPSKGLSYPKGHKISYRPYVFGELKKVSGSRTTFEELARIILAGIKTSFPIGDLTFYDFLYLALLRKLSTIGDTTIIATHTCPNKKCQVSNSYEIQVGPKNCEIDFWNVDYDELPVSVDLKLGDPEESTYEFYPLTILNYLKLERMNLHKDPTAKLAMQCGNASFEVIRPKLYRAYGEESIVLTQVEEILNHGVKPINVSCPACKAVNLLQLDGGNVVIRPFRSDEEVIATRIRFGKKPTHKSDPSV